MKKIFSFCKRYLLIHKWRLLLYVGINILASATTLISPFIMGSFIDQLVVAENIHFIFRYLIIFATITITTLILGYVSGRLYIRLQTTLGYTLNRDFIMRFQRAPLKYTAQQDAVYLNQRINQDANTLIIFCISIIQSVLVNAVMIIAPSMLLFYFHPILAVILFAVAVIYFIFYALYKQVLYRASHEFKESQSRFFAKLNEQMFNIRFIKLHGLFNRFIGRLNINFDGLMNSALNQQQKSYIFGGLDQLVMLAAQIVLLLFGGMEIIAGRLTIGQFVIISAYYNMILGAVRYFFGLGQTIQSNMVSYNRLQELVQIEPEINGTQILGNIESIELKQVSFSYGCDAIINNMDLHLKKGHIYAILGPNGAGKSTLVDIIIGLQAGNFSGEVLYNGVAVNNIDMYETRNRLIGVSEQEPTLMADTLAYNLDLDEQARYKGQDRLVDILGMKTFIDGLPNGFDTVINENAANISGGEKQKISIMRAIVKNPDVLVLDEPTSALDAAGCVALKQHLHELKKDKIIILVTHDLNILHEDDVVVTMGRK